MADSNESELSSAATSPDRRRETRWPSGEPAILMIPALQREVEVDLVDLSVSGMRVHLSEQLNVGEQVRVKFRDLEAFGEVRWCEQVEGPHHEAGIEISILV